MKPETPKKAVAAKPLAQTTPVQPKSAPVVFEAPKANETPNPTPKKKKSKKKASANVVDPAVAALEPSSNASGIVSENDEGWQQVTSRKKRKPIVNSSSMDSGASAGEGSDQVEEKATEPPEDAAEEKASEPPKTTERKSQSDSNGDHESKEAPTTNEGEEEEEEAALETGKDATSSKSKRKSKKGAKSATSGEASKPSEPTATATNGGAEGSSEWTVVGSKAKRRA